MSYNDYAGISDKTTWNFTSVDTPPEVVAFVPPDGDTNVDPFNASFAIEFNENIQAGTGNIYFKKVSDDSTIYTIDVTGAQVTIIDDVYVNIGPPCPPFYWSELEASTEYYIQVDNGAVQDLALKSWEGISDKTTWNFTTIA